MFVLFKQKTAYEMRISDGSSDVCTSDLKLFFVQPSNNEDQDYVLALIRHHHSVVTFSDAGAHVATTVNPIHAHLLGHWVRDKRAIELEAAIRKITFDIASFWGIEGRGWLREGNHADGGGFDLHTIPPSMRTERHPWG